MVGRGYTMCTMRSVRVLCWAKRGCAKLCWIFSVVFSFLLLLFLFLLLLCFFTFLHGGISVTWSVLSTRRFAMIMMRWWLGEVPERTYCLHIIYFSIFTHIWGLILSVMSFNKQQRQIINRKNNNWKTVIEQIWTCHCCESKAKRDAGKSKDSVYIFRNPSCVDNYLLLIQLLSCTI